MYTHESLVFTHGLHILDVDELAVNVEAELSQFIGNHHAVDTSVDGAVGTHLGGDGQGNTFQLVSNALGISLNLLQLLGFLLEFLGQHLLGTLGGDDTFTLGNKIVAAVAGLYVYDVVLVTQADHVFFQNYFHSAYSSYWLFHQIGYEGQECEVTCTLHSLSDAALVLE